MQFLPHFTSDVAVQKFTRLFGNKYLPEVTKYFGSEGYLKLKNAQVTKFEIPEISYILRSPDSILVSVSRGRLGVIGEWELRKTVPLLGELNKEGNFSVNLEKLEFSVSLLLSTDSQMGLSVSVEHCYKKFNQLDIKLQGDRLAKLVDKMFNHQVLQPKFRKMMEKFICQRITEVISFKHPLKFPISPNLPIIADLSLTSPPNVKSNYVETNHLGRFLLPDKNFNSSHSETPQLSQDLPDRMIQLQISQFSINSLLSAIHQSGAIRRSIDKNSAGGLAPMLASGCPGLCFSFFSDSLTKLYPNESAEIDIFSHSPPTVEILDGKLILNSLITVETFMRPPLKPSQRDLLFAVLIKIKAAVNLYVNDTYSPPLVYGNGTLQSFTMTVPKANLSDKKPADVGFVLEVFQDDIKNGIQKAINARLGNGFPLRNLTNADYLNPTLLLKKGEIYAATDLIA